MNRNTLRGQPSDGGPWTWAEKDALRLIRTQLDGASITTYVIATYHALCENCSDKTNQNPFHTEQPYLARLAGCSVRQLQKALKILGELGLVDVESSPYPFRGPCTYALRTICATLRTNGRQPDVLRKEEVSEKSQETDGEEASTSRDVGDGEKPKAEDFKSIEAHKVTWAIQNHPYYRLRKIPVAQELAKLDRHCQETGKKKTISRMLRFLDRYEPPIPTEAERRLHERTAQSKRSKLADEDGAVKEQQKLVAFLRLLEAGSTTDEQIANFITGFKIPWTLIPTLELKNRVNRIYKGDVRNSGGEPRQER